MTRAAGRQRLVVPILCRPFERGALDIILKRYRAVDARDVLRIPIMVREETLVFYGCPPNTRRDEQDQKWKEGEGRSCNILVTEYKEV